MKASQAYGSQGNAGHNIPPDADLIYDVTINDFEKVSQSCKFESVSDSEARVIVWHDSTPSTLPPLLSVYDDDVAVVV